MATATVAAVASANEAVAVVVVAHSSMRLAGSVDQTMASVDTALTVEVATVKDLTVRAALTVH